MYKKESYCKSFDWNYPIATTLAHTALRGLKDVPPRVISLSKICRELQESSYGTNLEEAEL